MSERNEIAVFGGGCFWCTEAVFKMLKGVTSVLPGYAGGIVANPTYGQVVSGNTGHAEVIRIEYDSSLVKYTDLLTVFFASHDPTTLNRQGHDIGTQYRSVVFYTTENQKIDIEAFIEKLNNSNEKGAPIITEVVPLDTFYEAENYQKDYYENHKESLYCELVINPKLEKVKQEFAQLLKDNNIQ